MLFTAYAIVRTVPSANRPNRRKKKCLGNLLNHLGEFHATTRYQQQSVMITFATSLKRMATLLNYREQQLCGPNILSALQKIVIWLIRYNKSINQGAVLRCDSTPHVLNMLFDVQRGCNVALVPPKALSLGVCQRNSCSHNRHLVWQRERERERWR